MDIISSDPANVEKGEIMVVEYSRTLKSTTMNYDEATNLIIDKKIL